jgi:DNA replication factor GINS
MNLEELQTARDRERQTDKLQQLRETFYADAGEFIRQLRAERDRAAERADDPFDAPEVNQLTDEINTAEQTVEAIYEKRVGKIVKAASFAAADLPAEAEGMTAEEQELFDRLVGEIKGNRQHVLDVLAGEDETTSGEPAGTPAPAESEDVGVSAADLMGSGGDVESSAERTGEGPSETPPREHSPEETAAEHRPENPGAGPSEVAGEPPGSDTPGQSDAVRHDGGQPATATGESPTDRPTGPAEPEGAGTGLSAAIDRRRVRITDDIDTFVGSDDRDYDLETNDVVTLPESNADLLIERDVAEEL